MAKIKKFNINQSLEKSTQMVIGTSAIEWQVKSDENVFTWSNKKERLAVIRQGIPYSSIDYLSKEINLPVKAVLDLVNIPQTTYNKKKKEKSLLDRQDSEFVVLLAELSDFGIKVFNQEKEKFHRWLKKPNLSLDGQKPESLLDTLTGITEVKSCLERIEYGNFA